MRVDAPRGGMMKKTTCLWAAALLLSAVSLFTRSTSGWRERAERVKLNSLATERARGDDLAGSTTSNNRTPLPNCFAML
ncbi:hypothetical protein EYF80_065561 [Liparis tanakae]|uniref:Secreted protein n=1 Tax=Liparis tanakae TaxID=230148 RepID=A0A4Z2E5X1_9TELE|nr:hypothetical protein EYF80_065561 [Liparis tanakae]